MSAWRQKCFKNSGSEIVILSQSDLIKLCGVAGEAARSAGALIRSRSGSRLSIDTKPGASSLASSLVTEVDLLSQTTIIEKLLPVCDRYDIALLAEEGADDLLRLEKDYFWSVDPLDGTLPFTENRPGYAVSIALVSRSGEALVGVVYDPVAQNSYHAIKGQGVTFNGQAWIPTGIRGQADSPSGKILTLICDRSFFDDPHYRLISRQFETSAVELGYAGLAVENFGGAVLNAVTALERAPSIYFKFPKEKGGSLWDYAATSIISQEAGALASDIYGNPLDLNRSDSTYMNHRGLIYCCRPELAKAARLLHAGYLKHSAG